MTMHAMIFSKIHILKKFPFVIFIAITIFQNLSFSDIDIFLCRYIININMLNTPELLAFHYKNKSNKKFSSSYHLCCNKRSASHHPVSHLLQAVQQVHLGLDLKLVMIITMVRLGEVRLG